MFPHPVFLDRIAETDRLVAQWIDAAPRIGWLDGAMALVSDKWSWVVPATLLVVLLLRSGGRRGRVALLAAVCALAVGDVLGGQMKELLQRARPCQALEHLRPLVGCGPSFSLPSNHALNSFALATVGTAFYRRGGLALFALASLVAYSRIHLGVHWVSDVVAGAVFGVLIGLAVAGTARRALLSAARGRAAFSLRGTA